MRVIVVSVVMLSVFGSVVSLEIEFVLMVLILVTIWLIDISFELVMSDLLSWFI